MDVSYVNPFIGSTIETFKTMVFIEATPKKPELKKDAVHSYDISGVIGLSGEAVGNIALSFPEDVALKAVSKMVSAEITKIDKELTDAIGEIVNIVAGYAKKDLTQFNLSISLPNVIIGTGHKIMAYGDVPTVIIPFGSEIGDFAMEITLKTR